MKSISDAALDRLRREAAFPELDGTRYSMVRRVGSGGMGEVYLVRDESLDRGVAMKVLSTIERAPELAARMLREARIVARLEHPGIVPVHDVGTLPDGRAYFTMKFVEGERLDRLAAGLALPDKLRTFHKVCEAVAFAHAHGVLHRDLKPENVMVGTFGEVLVMDWGIASVLRGDASSNADHAATAGDASPRTVEHAKESSPISPEIYAAHPGYGGDIQLNVSTIPDQDTHHYVRNAAESSDAAAFATGAGAVLGTPSYMAPEQALGAGSDLDERADIYGLGAILYFLLCGVPPRDDSARDDAAATVRRPRAIDAAIPRALDAVCMKSLADAREARYHRAADLADDIVRWLDGAPVAAYRENMLERSWRWIAKNRFVLLLVLAYLVMRVVVLLVAGH